VRLVGEDRCVQTARTTPALEQRPEGFAVDRDARALAIQGLGRRRHPASVARRQRGRPLALAISLSLVAHLRALGPCVFPPARSCRRGCHFVSSEVPRSCALQLVRRSPRRANRASVCAPARLVVRALFARANAFQAGRHSGLTRRPTRRNGRPERLAASRSSGRRGSPGGQRPGAHDVHRSPT
jgi:hypothetical protein